MNDCFPGLSLLVFVLVLALASLESSLVANATSLDVTDQSVMHADGGCSSPYVVRAGDTLSGIARRCGVSVLQLAQVNRLRLSDVIYPGQQLIVPAAVVATVTAPVGIPNQANASCPPRYTVWAGDTLARIARRCGTSVAKLKLWNGLRSDVIRVGQVLVTVPVSSLAQPNSTATPVLWPDPSYWKAPSPSIPAAADQAPETVSVPEPTYTPTPTPAASWATVQPSIVVPEPTYTPTPTPAIESTVSAW
ncbi:MAG: LysM peptidoglycan-binding domain-containing protein [Anaerolineae bacterium]